MVSMVAKAWRRGGGGACCDALMCSHLPLSSSCLPPQIRSTHSICWITSIYFVYGHCVKDQKLECTVPILLKFVLLFYFYFISQSQNVSIHSNSKQFKTSSKPRKCKVNENNKGTRCYNEGWISCHHQNHKKQIQWRSLEMALWKRNGSTTSPKSCTGRAISLLLLRAEIQM